MIVGWKHKLLGELCNITIGKTPSRGNKSYWDREKSTDNVWLSIADMLNTDGNVVSDSKEYLTDKGAMLCKPVSAGTLLASFKLTLGRLAFSGRDLYTNEAIASLVIKDESELSKSYLYHYLGHFDWDSATTGDVKLKGKTLNKQKLNEIPVYYPTSLKEQQHIVAILDQAFEGIAIATAKAEKNLANARELFDAHVQRFFFSPDSKWEEKRLKDVVAELVTGPFGSMLHKSDYVAKGIPVVNPQNIIDGAIVPLDKTMVSEETRTRLARFSLRKKDIIIARRGEMGRCAVVDEPHAEWLCGTGSMIIRLNENASEKYIVQLLQSSTVRKRLEGDAIGATMSNLNQDILLGVAFHLPPLQEQINIIGKLDELSSEIKKLETIYQQKLTALDELKKAILHQAFSGQLH